MPSELPNPLGTPGASPNLRQTLDRAVRYAHEQNHRVLSLDHLLLALTEDVDAAMVLAASGVDTAALRRDLAGFIGRDQDYVPPGSQHLPQPAEGVRKILDYATAAAEQSGRGGVDGGIVLAALVGEGRSPTADLLKAHGLMFQDAVAFLRARSGASGTTGQAKTAGASTTGVGPPAAVRAAFPNVDQGPVGRAQAPSAAKPIAADVGHPEAQVSPPTHRSSPATERVAQATGTDHAALQKPAAVVPRNPSKADGGDTTLAGLPEGAGRVAVQGAPQLPEPKDTAPTAHPVSKTSLGPGVDVAATRQVNAADETAGVASDTSETSSETAVAQAAPTVVTSDSTATPQPNVVPPKAAESLSFDQLLARRAADRAAERARLAASLPAAKHEQAEPANTATPNAASAQSVPAEPAAVARNGAPDVKPPVEDKPSATTDEDDTNASKPTTSSETQARVAVNPAETGPANPQARTTEGSQAPPSAKADPSGGQPVSVSDAPTTAATTRPTTADSSAASVAASPPADKREPSHTANAGGDTNGVEVGNVQGRTNAPNGAGQANHAGRAASNGGEIRHPDAAEIAAARSAAFRSFGSPATAAPSRNGHATTPSHHEPNGARAPFPPVETRAAVAPNPAIVPQRTGIAPHPRATAPVDHAQDPRGVAPNAVVAPGHRSDLSPVQHAPGGRAPGGASGTNHGSSVPYAERANPPRSAGHPVGASAAGGRAVSPADQGVQRAPDQRRFDPSSIDPARQPYASPARAVPSNGAAAPNVPPVSPNRAGHAATPGSGSPINGTAGAAVNSLSSTHSNGGAAGSSNGQPASLQAGTPGHRAPQRQTDVPTGEAAAGGRSTAGSTTVPTNEGDTTGQSARGRLFRETDEDLGLLTAVLPKRLRRGVGNELAIMVARSDVERLVGNTGDAGDEPEFSTRAMTLRLRSPDGKCAIETLGPETQWVEATMGGLLLDDDTVWRWRVTPNKLGRASLQLVVSARAIVSGGLSAETTFADEYADVSVVPDARQTLWQVGVTAGIVLVGVAIGLLIAFS